MCGTVPHPTAIALPPTFPAFLGLDGTTPLQVQAPNLSIMDLFHTAAGPQSVRFASLASEKPAPSSISRMVPLGYLLSSLLLQSPGAASQQEADLFRDFLLLSQSDGEPMVGPDQPHDFSVAEATAVLGVTGSFWNKRYGLDATVHPCELSPTCCVTDASPSPCTRSLHGHNSWAPGSLRDPGRH